jgi:hypothetical protein
MMQRSRSSALVGVLAGSIAALGVVGTSTSAEAGVATRTIVLPTSAPPGAGLNVTWHPGFRQYYAAGAGAGEPLLSDLYVYSETGAPLQEFGEIEHDLRSINYNANTGNLELMTFNARDGGIGDVGGRAQGLFAAGLDGSGLVTGSTSLLLATVPGNLGRQTMPVYDTGRNLFYSFSIANTVHRVSRVDGSLLGTITLDTAPIGNPGFSFFAGGFDEQNDLLVVASSATNQAYTFRLDGSYVDTWDLDIAAPFAYGVGFANGQLFVYDGARSAWQGYAIPAPASLGLLCLGAVAGLRRRR